MVKKVSKAELIREVIARQPGLNISGVIQAVLAGHGVKVTSSDVSFARRTLRPAATSPVSEPAPEHPANGFVAPVIEGPVVMIPPPSVVEVVRSARALISLAGSKDGAKELIDLL